MKVEDFLKQNRIEQEIDAVYPIKKIRIDEDSVLLYLEDEKIRISDEAYFSYGIKNLKGLDEELYQKLKDDETLFKAYKSCLRKLSFKATVTFKGSKYYKKVTKKVSIKVKSVWKTVKKGRLCIHHCEAGKLWFAG